MKNKLVGYIFLIIIPLVTIELLSLVYLSVTNFKIKLPGNYLEQYSKHKESKECSWGDWVSHHPYLMLRYKRSGHCVNELSNQRGLVGPDFGNDKDLRYYNFLLLGGSVAELLFETGKLEEELNKKYYSPSNKPFKVWNAAMAAGQQPRQSIANLMYGDIADVVVSLEGYNEQFNLMSLFPIESPALTWYELEEVLLSNLDSSRAPSTLRQLITIAAKGIKRGALLKHSYSGVTIVHIAERLNSKYSASLVAEVNYDQQGSLEKARDSYLKKYKSYITSMGAVAQSRDQKLFIFFQPVPAINKKLTANEVQVVGDLSYKDNYLKTVSSLIRSDQENVYIKNLLDIFKNYEEELYSDNIHFVHESKGNEILTAKMVDFIAEKLKLKKRI